MVFKKTKSMASYELQHHNLMKATTVDFHSKLVSWETASVYVTKCFTSTCSLAIFLGFDFVFNKIIMEVIL